MQQLRSQCLQLCSSSPFCRPLQEQCLQGAVVASSRRDPEVRASSGMSSQRGCPVPAVPEDAAETWSHEQILQHFADACGICPKPSASSSHRAQSTESAGQGLGPGHQPPSFPRPTQDEFDRWFPGLTRSGTRVVHGPRLWLLCLPCAGSAEDMYSSEGTGARRQPSPLLEWCRAHKAELLAAQPPGRGLRLKDPVCADAQELAAQLLQVVGHRLAPGPPSASSPGAVAANSHTSVTPWVLVSHSVGCWVGYELLRRVRAAGLPLPAAWLLSAMPSPDIPVPQRPWRRQQDLGPEEFKDEMRGWDISEVVFTPAMWPIYQPLLRADCTLFDSYVHKPLQPPVMSPGAAHAADSSTGLRPGISGVTTADSVSCSGIAGDRAGTPAGTPSASVDGPMSACCSAPADTQPSTQLGGGGPSDVGEAPFPGLPIFAWWGGRDRRVSKELVHGWSRFTSGPFQMTCMPGGTHLWPLDPALKPQWLKELVGHLESLGLGNE